MRFAGIIFYLKLSFFFSLPFLPFLVVDLPVMFYFPRTEGIRHPAKNADFNGFVCHRSFSNSRNNFAKRFFFRKFHSLMYSAWQDLQYL